MTQRPSARWRWLQYTFRFHSPQSSCCVVPMNVKLYKSPFKRPVFFGMLPAKSKNARELLNENRIVVITPAALFPESFTAANDTRDVKCQIQAHAEIVQVADKELEKEMVFDVFPRKMGILRREVVADGKRTDHSDMRREIALYGPAHIVISVDVEEGPEHQKRAERRDAGKERYLPRSQAGEQLFKPFRSVLPGIPVFFSF